MATAMLPRPLQSLRTPPVEMIKCKGSFSSEASVRVLSSASKPLSASLAKFSISSPGIQSTNFVRRRTRDRYSSLRVHSSSSYSSPFDDSASEPIDVVADVKNEKILVLGGNGFVGSAICKEAIAQGIEVVSLNRSGPPSYTDSWVNDVKWIKGDVFKVNWDSILDGVDTVISCLGGFGTNEQMERICGDATVTAVNAVQNTGVEKFIFISVHDYNLPSFALNNGYFNGKRRAEKEVLDKFPLTGVVLRPGFIYGKRRVNNVDIPLDLVGQPLEKVIALTENITKPLQSLPASDLVFAPPVSVEDVASAVIKAIVDDSVRGIFNIQQIKELSVAKKL